MINRLHLHSRLATVNLSEIQPPQLGAKNRVASSVGLLGILDEIKVTVVTDHPVYRYRILDGGRRFETLQNAKCERVDVKIFEADEVVLETITAVSNLCRSHNFVREAQALQTIGRLSANLDEIALATGLSQHAIRAALKLANLPEDVLEAVGDTVSSGVARRLAQLEDFERDLLIADIRRAIGSGKRYTQKHYRKSLERLRPPATTVSDRALLEPNLTSIATAILSPEQLRRLEAAGLCVSFKSTQPDSKPPVGARLH